MKAIFFKAVPIDEDKSAPAVAVEYDEKDYDSQRNALHEIALQNLKQYGGNSNINIETVGNFSANQLRSFNSAIANEELVKGGLTDLQLEQQLEKISDIVLKIATSRAAAVPAKTATAPVTQQPSTTALKLVG